MRAQKIGQPSKPFEAVTPNDRSYEPQMFIDPQSIARDERQIRIENHEHNGSDAPQINFLDLLGFIESVDAVPTIVPKNLFDQVKLYSNAGTRRIYFYVMDSVGVGAWRYAALT